MPALTYDEELQLLRLYSLSFPAYITCSHAPTPLLQKSTVLLFVKEGSLIGSVSYVNDNSMVYIYNLCVHPLHRRQSYATALMQFLIMQIGAMDCCLEVESCNISAIRLYEKLGFTTANAANSNTTTITTTGEQLGKHTIKMTRKGTAEAGQETAVSEYHDTIQVRDVD